MSLYIRPVQTADMTAVTAIYNHYVPHTIVTFDEDLVSVEALTCKMEATVLRFPWLVAEEKSEILGYAYASSFRVKPAYRHTVETTIYLAPEQVGRGVGRTLYRALLMRLQEQGLRQALGVIAIPNEPSIALHKKLGFQCQGRLVRVGYKLNQWIDTEYWQLDLEVWQP
ncbi:GNAT family N-acetyltransferase [Planctomycetota bacterium]